MMQKIPKLLLALLLIIPIGHNLAKGTDPKIGTLSEDKILTLDLEESASLNSLESHYKGQSTFLSEVYEAEFPFELLGLTWMQELPGSSDAHLEIKFRSKDGVWTDWQHIEMDQDGATTDDDKLHSYIITDSSVAFQYRAILSTADKSVTPKLADMTFEYIDGGKSSMYSKLSKLVFSKSSDVIARNTWGANESLRYSSSSVEFASDDENDSDKDENEDPDLEIVKTVEEENGKKLLWPLEYPKEVKKIIIHHTATSENLDDPDAAIRAIYQYHAVSRGWGDIGYNFIIAPDGTIYEGRYGGDGVVAGHTSGYNTGTVGIALLGNYQDESIPAPMMKSLSSLVYEKAELHDIDPDSSSTFHGSVMSNILGHRDLGATACPGEHTYDYLPKIREIVGESMDKRKHTNSDSTYAFEESEEREMVIVDPQGTARLTIKIKNTGTATWNSSTYLNYLSDDESKKILTLSSAMMNETSVAPGKTATFTLDVTAGLYGGLANFDLSPVFNGSKKVRNYIDLSAYVERPLLKFSVSSSDITSKILKPGESANVTVKLKNTGNLTWSNSGTNAVTLEQSGDSKLVSSDKLASLKETTVAPGSTGTFEFKITAPSSGGNYSLYYVPAMSNSNAAVKSSGTISVKVTSTTQDATLSDAGNDTDFTPGEKKTFSLNITNNTSKTWTSSSTNKLTFGVTKSGNMTVSDPKLSVNSLGSGRSAKITFTVTAPTTPGEYTIYLRPRIDKKNVTSSAYTIKITVADEDVDTNTSSFTNPIRIKLTPDTAITPILTSSSSFSVYDNTTLLKNFSANNRVRVAQSGDKFVVSSGSYKTTVSGPVIFTPANGAVMQITSWEQRPAWNPSLNDNMFRGNIEIRNVDGVSTIINELSLEDYIKGIGEVSNGDPDEKIKTMMILSRSYAYYYMTQAEKFAGKPYHLDDDPNVSQKYLGYGFEIRSPNVTKQAAATAGEVVTYNGKVIKTPYFSKSDGVATKSAKEVWGWTDTPWLVSVSDTYCTGSTKFEGHGVGLSGCGATAMAKSGISYKEIIKYYFAGVDIQKL